MPIVVWRNPCGQRRYDAYQSDLARTGRPTAAGGHAAAQWIRGCSSLVYCALTVA